jgi:uncharacterized protein
MTEQHISKQISFESLTAKQLDLLGKVRTACKKIAPVWPLENFVAVNPYLGLTNQSFGNAAKELAAAGGIQMTLPASFYLEKIKTGEIIHEDLEKVLIKNEYSFGALEFIKTIEKYTSNSEDLQAIASLSDIATEVTQKDWNRFMISRISAWAASYFDKGQAIWSVTNQEGSLFLSWKNEAEIDLTPQLSGLKDFRKKVSKLPDHPIEAIQYGIEILGVPEKGMSIYLHRLLVKVGGWSAYAGQLDWENNLYNGKDGKLIEFLAVLISWEACLFETLKNDLLKEKWNAAIQILAIDDVSQKMNHQLFHKLILQEAFDVSAQRKIVNKFQVNLKNNIKRPVETKAQAIFCIDVRSEVFRRNLELVDSEIKTFGFAGFFGLPIKYVPLGHIGGEAQCPVLLKTGPTILEELVDYKQNKVAIDNRVLAHQVNQIWKSFKAGAVTCFSFVSPMGLTYLPKLFTDSFGLTRPVTHPDKIGLNNYFSKSKTVRLAVDTYNNESVGIEIESQIEMAKNALTAMSLTDKFAPFVLIVGHGSTTVNNPHATGLDCGACGGHTGEANAKVAAAILNNTQVRAGLQTHNIFIPKNTIFLACLHDTTTDEVSIFNLQDVPDNRKTELVDLQQSLSEAAKASRSERSLRMYTNSTGNTDKSIIGRSKDWSQTRPEWGLAGCSTFIIAPRERSLGVDLEGKSFLHTYDWKKDENFGVLEAIMTAPMVVTSWINLQYYASTVDNENFGSGNKTLHNITAGLGVLEGYSGDLRVGLPWQSVHDGEKFQHEPLKLNVIIEAPISAINNVIKKHMSVRNLCDNGWLKILIMNEVGEISHRYDGNLIWEELNKKVA